MKLSDQRKNARRPTEGKGLNGSGRAAEQALAQAIQSLRPKHALKHLLRASGMARSTFYYRIGERPDKHASLCKQIEGVYRKHKGRYGYRRVWQTLRVAGLTINRKTVARLMRKMSLFGITPKRHYRSYKGDVGKIAPNVLNRDFAAAGPYEKLTTDISQFVIGDRKLYVSPILDMWNGEIISIRIIIIATIHERALPIPRPSVAVNVNDIRYNK